jgi:hypothetical protein
MPAGTNPALIIGGPAVIVGRGTSIFSKDPISLEPRLTTFPIEVSTLGTAEEREDAFTYGLRFTPTGKLADLTAYYPYASRRAGELLHLVEEIAAVDETGDTVTITGGRFRNGHGVRAASFGTLPAGLVATTKYYIHKIDANTWSFHEDADDALTGDNPVNITDAGTGRHRVIEEEELIIWSINEGRGIRFHNHIIDQQPEINARGNATAFGQLGIECFRKHGVDPADANSFYTEISVAPTYTPYDPADDITQVYTGAWGAVAPWASFVTRGGFGARFGVNTDPVPDDAVGIISRRISSLSAEVTASPRGVDETHVRAKLGAQGAGAGRGRRITGDNLNISATDLYLRLYRASLSQAPELYDKAADRIGDLVWRANLGVTGGVADPLFYIGAEAPA